MPVKTEIRISGLGGQGVVLAGVILGKAAVYAGKNAVQTQSYGAEARGSAAKSEVIISRDKIGFPIVRRYDILVAMSQEAVNRNVNDLKEDCVFIVDYGIVKNVPKIKGKVFKIPASTVAEKTFGKKLYANMIMLGALNKIAKLLDGKFIRKAIKDTLPEKAALVNIQAYEKGRKLIE
jgi:2-oxoglutarate ferredoxin oxidoreductase subunit gamma